MAGETTHEAIREEVERLFKQATDWVSFYRETLGLHGTIRRFCRTPDQLRKFEQTDLYTKIQGMISELREELAPAQTKQEPTRMISVRLPKSLHEALRVEAHEHHTSMNKLCISKLLRSVDM